MVARALQNGHQPSQEQLSEPFVIAGVGSGTQSCNIKMTCPVALPEDSGQVTMHRIAAPMSKGQVKTCQTFKDFTLWSTCMESWTLQAVSCTFPVLERCSLCCLQSPLPYHWKRHLQDISVYQWTCKRRCSSAREALLMTKSPNAACSTSASAPAYPLKGLLCIRHGRCGCLRRTCQVSPGGDGFGTQADKTP